MTPFAPQMHPQPMLGLGKVKFTWVFFQVAQHWSRGSDGRKSKAGGKQGGISEHLYVMYLIAAIKMAVCLVDRTDDDVSQNHCVSNCSSTKTCSCSNCCKIGNL